MCSSETSVKAKRLLFHFLISLQSSPFQCRYVCIVSQIEQLSHIGCRKNEHFIHFVVTLQVLSKAFLRSVHPGCIKIEFPVCNRRIYQFPSLQLIKYPCDHLFFLITYGCYSTKFCFFRYSTYSLPLTSPRRPATSRGYTTEQNYFHEYITFLAHLQRLSTLRFVRLSALENLLNENYLCRSDDAGTAKTY